MQHAREDSPCSLLLPCAPSPALRSASAPRHRSRALHFFPRTARARPPWPAERPATLSLPTTCGIQNWHHQFESRLL
jgi:hypothetical protein